MPGRILLSAAYLPPVEYLSLITGADQVFIEAHENYIKQTYRNRCYILTASGVKSLSVPVYEGSRHKVAIGEARIDYSKRWQQVHLRALRAAYANAPYFEFYIDEIEKIISEKREYLFELDFQLLKKIMRFLNIKKEITGTFSFESCNGAADDKRYSVDPENREQFTGRKYMQVFGNGTFASNLSIIDLLFNKGPEALGFL